MFILERSHRLEFDYNFRVNYEVSTNVSNRVFIKHDWDDSFRLIWNVETSESNFHGVVVDAFRKTWPEDVPYTSRYRSNLIRHAPCLLFRRRV